jgi:hypothetical protein
MTIDAIILAPLTIFFVVGVCWVIGKAYHFEQEVAWSRRKE